MSPSKEPLELTHIKSLQFSGDSEDWSSFKNLYVPLVHDNAVLTNVQKLLFLKNSVSGAALRLIASLIVTDSNYAVAWKIINDFYN